MLNFELGEEENALIESTQKFVRERIIPVAADCDRHGELPESLFKEAWELGLVAPIIPEAYGGIGLRELDHVLITEELAYGCTGIQTSLTANALAATPILLAGNEAQKKKYLGMLTSEPVYAAYALTEPGAGSDAAGITTKARKVGQDWVIDGQKCYITNGSWARWFIVFATTDAKTRHKGIMAFVVDRDTPGISVGKKEDKLGQRASDTATIIFDEVKVPASQLLAPEGDGFRLAMQT
ncbi:MAG: acyl-CoA dehydrogenase family protein, partial [Polyangiales bacterium]